jgi:hypothetical protein
MFMSRRIGNDCIRNAAVRNLIIALLQRHRHDRSHRRHTAYVDFRQLFDKGENGVEFAAEVFQLALGDRNSRQMRDAADSFDVDGHPGAIAEGPAPANTSANPTGPISAYRAIGLLNPTGRYRCQGRVLRGNATRKHGRIENREDQRIERQAQG